jgi:hypothetical protein
MNLSLSSSPTTPFYFVFPGQGDFAGQPELALESLLTSYGLPQSREWVTSLGQWVNHSIYGLVELIGLLDPGLNQVKAALLELWLGQRQDLTDVTQYLGYADFDLTQAFDPTYLVVWASQQQPVIKVELESLLRGDLLSFLSIAVQRITKTPILDLGSATTLSGLLGKAYAPVALGHLTTQEFYFTYVSQIKTAS